MIQRKRLSRHFVDNGTTKEIAMIFAFWKNDDPSGLGLSYHLDDEKVCAVFADMFEAYKKLYEQADDKGKLKQIANYAGQLQNHKELLRGIPGFEICLIANVWFLESLGLLKSDEYNGIMAIYQ